MPTIKDMQLKKKKEEVTNSLIKKSIIPTKTTISNILKDFFERKKLGEPDFKPIEIEKDSTSNPKVWNKSFKDLDNDLNILFDALVDQNNKILSNYEMYMYENDKLHANIVKLNLSIQNLKDTLNAKGNLYTNHQTFENFYSTEFNEIEYRNIPTTDSYIDLAQRKVINNKKTTSKDKVNISKAKIKIDKDHNVLSEKSIGDIGFLLNDYTNEVYHVNYLTSPNVKTINLNLNVTLQSIKEMSTVMLECVSINNFDATLYISTNNVDFKEVYTINSNNLFEWNFDRQEVGYIKIVINKRINDSYSNDRNIFDFIFKNLSCINDYFYLKSTYVSKPLEFDAVLDSVTLKSDEIIFPGTNINYFIGLDNDKNDVEWISVNNNEKCNLGLLDKNEKIANNSLDEYGKNVKGDCVSILNLKQEYNINSIKVYYGYQMWGLKTLEIPDSEDINNYDPTIEDYTDYYVKRKSLIDTEEYSFEIRNGYSHLMTQYIYTDNVGYVYNKFIKPLNNGDKKFNCKVYLNNAQIKEVDGKYNFTLRKGKNVVHILMYVNCTDRNEFTKITHNFNFKEHTFNVFADRPMKYINDKTLMEDIIENNNKYYSVYNNKIIVKEDMRMVNEHIKLPLQATSINYKNNSRYLVTYKSISNIKAKQYLVNKEKTRIRVLAILLSNNESLSPKINNFRLVGE